MAILEINNLTTRNATLDGKNNLQCNRKYTNVHTEYYSSVKILVTESAAKNV